MVAGAIDRREVGPELVLVLALAVATWSIAAALVERSDRVLRHLVRVNRIDTAIARLHQLPASGKDLGVWSGHAPALLALGLCAVLFASAPDGHPVRGALTCVLAGMLVGMRHVALQFVAMAGEEWAETTGGIRLAVICLLTQAVNLGLSVSTASVMVWTAVGNGPVIVRLAVWVAIMWPAFVFAVRAFPRIGQLEERPRRHLVPSPLAVRRALHRLERRNAHEDTWAKENAHQFT